MLRATGAKAPALTNDTRKAITLNILSVKYCVEAELNEHCKAAAARQQLRLGTVSRVPYDLLKIKKYLHLASFKYATGS